MECLFECLAEEFKDVEFSSMNISPTHTVSYTKDGVEENIITLTITVYNNIHKIVGKKIIRFVNDKYKISPTKKLEHIPPENLDSVFMISKEAIINEIYEDYKKKYDAILSKVQKLEAYVSPQQEPQP